MDTVIRWVLLFVGAGLTLQTARPHFEYGNWLDAASTFEILDVPIPVGMGTIMVFLHIGKVMMPAAGAMFWYRAQRIRCVLAFLVFPLLVIVSITSTLAFLDLQRGERVASEAARFKREADLRADLAATEARLKNTGWWRPAAVVEHDITAERRNALWSGTDSCTQATTRQERRYCGALDRLAGELAAAREAEDDRRREKEIRTELLGLAATNASSHPDLDFLSRALEVSLEQAGFWRTVLFAAAIEAAEALFILLGAAPARHDPQRCERRRGLGGRLLFGWWHGHEWTRCWFSRQAKHTSLSSRQAETGVRSGAQAIRTTRDSAPGPHEMVPPARVEACSQSDTRAELQPQFRKVGMAPEAAVHAFVASLSRDPNLRASGSALRDAYERVREQRGWPRIPPNVFGQLLRLAVEAAGGCKVKASRQTYRGVALPPGLLG